MGWLVAILVIIAVVAFPKVRKVVAVVAAIAAIGLVAWYLTNQREEAASKSRVTANELDISDLRLGRAQYGSSYRLTGRVQNLSSRFTISSLQIRMVLKDCLQANDCSVVGDSIANVWVSVPPGQVRAIDDSVYFSDVPPFRGTFEWNYEIVEIKAK